MKKALKLLLAYFGWLFAGIIFGTFFYSLYLHSLNLVAGVSSPVLNRENLIVSFFTVSQTLPFIIGFLLIAYRIRRPGNFVQLIFFVLCMFLSWCLILPLSNHFERSYFSRHSFTMSQEDSGLSTGYFRESSGKVYYFLNDTNTNAVRIDTSEKGTSEIVTDSWAGYAAVSGDALPYKDVLIKDSFKAKSSNYSFLGTPVLAAKRDLNRGTSYWLGFLSLAIALASIYALSGLTSWRIANYSICGILYGGILFWNGYFWTPEMTHFRNLSFMSAGPFAYFKNWITSPFMTSINLLFALVLTVIGIVSVIIKKKRGR